MVKGDDCDLIGLRARLVPSLVALEAAPHADRDQPTQQQEPPDHQHQPGMGRDTELGQILFTGHLLMSLTAHNMVNLKAKQSHLGLCPAEFGQYLGMQIHHPLQAPAQVLHHPQRKHFSCCLIRIFLSVAWSATLCASTEHL